MNTPTPKISPLRQRMIEDMRIRKLEPKTQSSYIRAVRHFTVWFGRSPDRAGPEDLRLFQLHLVDKGVSPISINAMQSGLRFFFDITLNRPELMAKVRSVRVPQRLPVVLSREEATRLIIEATRNISIELPCRWRMVRDCAPAKSLASRSVTWTANAMYCVSSKARAARIATRYCHRSCSRVFAAGGATRGPRARYYPTAGYFRGSIRCSP